MKKIFLFVFIIPTLLYSSDLTFVDLPYNFHTSFKQFSMHQSLNITFTFSTALHTLTTSGILHSKLPANLKLFLWALTLTGEDYLLFYIPGGYSWLHEEWHRATLSLRGVKSYDEIYSFPLFRRFVSVDHIRDEDLEKIKNNFPHDLIRAEEAGVEGQFYYAEEIRKYCFFNGSRCLEEIPQLLTNIVNSSFYILFSSTREAEKETLTMEKEEGTEISRRDAFGLDFTAWVYDLFRSREPYKMRGTHPSGVGIKRYIAPSQLSSKELNYLKLQGYLTWLNIVSPQLLAISPSRQWNFYFTHYLTPWGFSAGASLLIRDSNSGYFLAGKVNSSLYRNLPEIDMEIWKKITHQIEIRVDAKIWLQPENQDFYAKKGKTGGSMELYIYLPLDEDMSIFFNPFFKSEGWIPGNEYLEAISGIRIGTSLRGDSFKDDL